MTNSPPVIVTDGVWRKSLSAVRSLGKAGYEVILLSDTPLAPARWSRYCARSHWAPDAQHSAEGFLTELLRILRMEKERTGARAILFPMEDATLAACLENETLLAEQAHFLLPPRESFQIARDKAKTQRFASSLGLRVPETFSPSHSAELIAALPRYRSGYLLKPAQGSGSAGVRYELELQPEDIETHWKAYGPLLIQERIPREGTGLGASLLFDRAGKCFSGFTHRRLREYPVTGGPSTDRESIDAPELLAQSRLLLEKLGWRGPAMVEWKVNPKNGQAYLLEINPRFWGSLELAVRAGADFPSWYARLARGETPPAPQAFTKGIRSRTLWPGDLFAYFGTPKHKREPFLKFLKGLPREADEWDPTDLASSIAYPLLMLLLALRPKYWRFLRKKR